METKVVEASIVETIGEYGIVKVREETVWDNGKVFCRTTLYDVCLERGEGDIVASFPKISDARKWAKEN
jgi:hypothetical protein